MTTWEDILGDASHTAKTRHIAFEARDGPTRIEASVEVGHDSDVYSWDRRTLLAIEVSQACIQVSDVSVDLIHPHGEKLVRNKGRFELAASQYSTCMRLVSFLVRVSDVAAFFAVSLKRTAQPVIAKLERGRKQGIEVRVAEQTRIRS
jgi:hypothetical protein